MHCLAVLAEIQLLIVVLRSNPMKPSLDSLRFRENNVSCFGNTSVRARKVVINTIWQSSIKKGKGTQRAIHPTVIQS